MTNAHEQERCVWRVLEYHKNRRLPPPQSVPPRIPCEKFGIERLLPILGELQGQSYELFPLHCLNLFGAVNLRSPYLRDIVARYRHRSKCLKHSPKPLHLRAIAPPCFRDFAAYTLAVNTTFIGRSSELLSHGPPRYPSQSFAEGLRLEPAHALLADPFDALPPTPSYAPQAPPSCEQT